jgi:hypothetical protein
VNQPLAAAGVLAILIGAAHSILGERYIISRLLRRKDLPHLFGSDLFTRHTLRFAWHLTTVAWCGFALMLLQAARGPSSLSAHEILQITAATFAASAVVALVGSRGRHLSWMVFIAIAILALLGAKSL